MLAIGLQPPSGCAEPLQRLAAALPNRSENFREFNSNKQTKRARLSPRSLCICLDKT
jgi:hypothetical protein